MKRSITKKFIGRRLFPLEACRGIAAIIVFIHHFFLGFAPFKTGLLPETRNPDSFIGNWYFFIFNGTSAVTFFFTLSGFVLCWKYFKSGDKSLLLNAFLKRYLRLLVPVLLTTLMSYFIFKFGLYFFVEAGSISKSPWLSTFANAGWTSSFIPTFSDSFTQGLTTFFTGEINYNSSLWTMKPEFIGSIFVFCIASFVSGIKTFGNILLILCFLSIWSLIIYPYLFPFIIGLFLASHCSKCQTKTNLLFSVFLILIGLYILGYSIPEKDYLWIQYIKFPYPIKDNIKLILHTIGSSLIIWAIMSNDYIFKNISGKKSQFLGKLSFPLYLIHVLVICSLGSYIYLTFNSYQYSSTLIVLSTFVTISLFSLLLTIPIIYIDDFWLKIMRRFK